MLVFIIKEYRNKFIEVHHSKRMHVHVYIRMYVNACMRECICMHIKSIEFGKEKLY